MKSDNEHNPLPRHVEQIRLQTMTRSDDQRTIAYSVAGDTSSSFKETAVFFYPVGSSRRQVISMHQIAASSHLRIVCVNRPGKGGTSKALKSGPVAHAKTAVSDIVHVLNEKLQCKERVALLFMCAGATFALAFASQHPDRVTQLLGIAPWVQPADCPDTRCLYRMGTSYLSPNWIVTPTVAAVMIKMERSLAHMSPSRFSKQLEKMLSQDELNELRKIYPEEQDILDFQNNMAWAQEETGGDAIDVAVLLTAGSDMGINYQAGLKVTLYHGDKDFIIPIGGCRWLHQQLNRGGESSLIELFHGSHEGALFLLYPRIVEAIRELAGGKSSPSPS